MGRTYEAWDNDRLDEILKEKGGHNKRIGEVLGIRYKVKVKCEKCGHEWEATPQTLAVSGCPMDARMAKRGRHRKAKYTFKEVKRIVEENDYKLLSTKYINNKAPITFIDEENGKTITTSFRNFLLTYKKKDVN